MPNLQVHPTALVETKAIGEGTRIWAYAHLLPGARVGSHCNLGDHLFVESGAVIGNRVTIKNNVCVWEGVTIQDGAFIGPGVTFTNDRYPRSPRLPAAQTRYQKRDNWLLPTVVEEGASIGAAAVILPGLRIGRYSTVGAGACVTEDVAPFCLVIGNPARVVGCVCRCGQKLAGCHLETTCRVCGESPAERMQSATFTEAHSS